MTNNFLNSMDNQISTNFVTSVKVSLKIKIIESFEDFFSAKFLVVFSS